MVMYFRIACKDSDVLCLKIIMPIVSESPLYCQKSPKKVTKIHSQYQQSI